MFKIISMRDNLETIDWIYELPLDPDDLPSEEMIGWVQGISQVEAILYLNPLYEDHELYQNIDEALYPEITGSLVSFGNKTIFQLDFHDIN